MSVLGLLNYYSVLKQCKIMTWKKYDSRSNYRLICRLTKEMFKSYSISRGATIIKPLHNPFQELKDNAIIAEEVSTQVVVIAWQFRNQVT